MQDKIDLLSPREREVLRLLGTGMNNVEVCEKLGLSPNTTSTHLQRATKKLGARHPHHATMLVLRHELREEFKRSTWGKK